LHALKLISFEAQESRKMRIKSTKLSKVETSKENDQLNSNASNAKPMKQVVNVAKSKSAKNLVTKKGKTNFASKVLQDVTNAYVTDKELLAEHPNLFKDNAPLKKKRTMDIDSIDKDDPIAFSEYVSELYQFLKEGEAKYRTTKETIENQPIINSRMRGILVDWLVEVHLSFKMMPDTLYLAVYIVDKFMESENISKNNFQLVGITALFIAAKYEEIYPPPIEDFAYVTDGAFEKNDLIATEEKILEALEYRLTVPTTYMFLLRYLKAARADRKIVQLSCFASERGLLNSSLLQFLPSEIASAVIFMARRCVGKRRGWTSTLEKYTGYCQEDIMPCIEEISEMMKSESKFSAVKDKFSSRKFGAVAELDICWDI